MRSIIGIHVVDTGFHRPRFDAAYLIVESGRAAFVDTGTNASVPRLLAALDRARPRARRRRHGDPPRTFTSTMPAGVGRLMQHLPSARLVVHPRGARHPDRPGPPGAKRDEGLRRRGDRALLRHDRRRRCRARASHDRRHDAGARRPSARLPAYARPRDAPPLHLGCGQPELLHPATPSASRIASSTPAPVPGSRRRRRRCSSSPRPCAARSPACSSTRRAI